MKRLDFKWCLINKMKRGGGGNGRWMRCGDRGIDSMACEVGAVLEGGGSRQRGRTFVFGKRIKKRSGWAEWPNWPMGWLGQLGQKLKRNFFQNKNWIFFNLPKLWKFVQGDLGGILMWEFFLNSSRLLKDFRKI
jgi:hypothetical protein